MCKKNEIHLQLHSLNSKRKIYGHRVKWFTTKNKKKRIKTIKRSSKRITKIRHITPHAMCRHIVGGKATFKALCRIADQKEPQPARMLRGSEEERWREWERNLPTIPLYCPINQYVWSSSLLWPHFHSTTRLSITNTDWIWCLRLSITVILV